MFSPTRQASASKPHKTHRSGPCPGRGCPVCKSQRQARNTRARRTSAGKSRRAYSTGGMPFAASHVLSAATAAPIASQAYYDDQATREYTSASERAALDALHIAEEDGSLDMMPSTLFLEDDVLEALDGSGWLMVMPAAVLR